MTDSSGPDRQPWARSRTSGRRGWSLGVLVVGLSLIGAACGQADATSPSTTKAPSPVANAAPTDPTGPNVSAQVDQARGQVASLETTVGSWGLTCEMHAQMQLELAYVRDALNQGNILGASELLEVTKAAADDNSRSGLLSASDASEFDALSTQLLAQIPTSGFVPDEFHPTSGVPFPEAPPCPRTLPAGTETTTSGVTQVTSSSNGQIPDTNEMLRMLLKFAAGQVPYVGKVLAGLIEILWPADKPPTWQQMSEYVDARIGQAVDAIKREQLNGYLNGITEALHDYVRAAQTPKPWSDDDKVTLKANFVSALTSIKLVSKQFAPDPSLFPHTYLILPEYTQMENLLFTQLRDGVLNGPSFGLDPRTNDYQKQLTDGIRSASAYLDAQIPKAIAALPKPDDRPPANQHYNVNLFNRQAALRDALIPLTTDESYYWPYMDPSKYPVTSCSPPAPECASGVTIPPNTRLLEVPALGSIDDNGTPKVAPGGEITRFHIWGWSYVDAIQMTYGAGPPGPKMGDQRRPVDAGVVDFPKGGGNFVAGSASGSSGAITRVYGHAGNLPDTIGLIFTKGNATTDTGEIPAVRSPGGAPYSFQFPGEVLSSVNVMGTSRFYRTADCVVLAFRYADSLPTPSG